MSSRHSVLGGVLLLAAASGGVPPALSQTNLDAELKAMADTERAFARRSVEQGMRQAFYEFFAEEGIAFQPQPVRLRESQRSQPAPSGPPPASTLDWEPVYGDIARSADLGWLTGPFVVTDQSPQKRPPRWGFYSSVWKKQPDGTWRVLADLGVSTPAQQGALPRNVFRAAPHEPLEATPGARGGDLRQAEQTLARQAARGVAAAYSQVLSPSARLHRNGDMPFTTPASIREFLATQPPSGSWETLHAETSRAGDLGYTHGKYQLAKDGAAVEKGYYMRVWKRNANGEWKLVLDVTSPLPAESK